MKRRLALILLGFAISACTPQVQEYRPPADPRPHLSKNMFHAGDGIELPYRAWLPKNKPRAVIVALHGFNDYSRAFEGPGKFFAARGIATYAYDQRGFGASPQTGLWADERNLVSDFKEFTALVSKRHPGRPLYILGESMGGAVTVSALSGTCLPPIKGLIFIAPAVWGGETFDPFMRAMAWAAGHMFPSHIFTGEDLKIQATDNIALLREMSKDPLVLKGTRADAVYGLVQLMDSAYEKTSPVETPVLILYGKRDEVIPYAPVKHAGERMRDSAQFAYYPDGYHMLLRDLQGEVVLKDIASWMDHPDRPLPSGFAREPGAEVKSLDHPRGPD